MRQVQNCLEAGALRPHFLGFIFYPLSPRFVGHRFLLPEELPSAIKKVGVFVDETISRIKETALRYRLDAVQLHGSETPKTCALLKEVIPAVIKSFSVHTAFDFRETEPYHHVADYFLFDTKGDKPGGNGVPFNWELLKKYDQETPFFLSGGINFGNLPVIKTLQYPALAGIDLNSGFEISPGIKNVQALRQAINILKPETT